MKLKIANMKVIGNVVGAEIVETGKRIDLIADIVAGAKIGKKGEEATVKKERGVEVRIERRSTEVKVEKDGVEVDVEVKTDTPGVEVERGLEVEALLWVVS